MCVSICQLLCLIKLTILFFLSLSLCRYKCSDMMFNLTAGYDTHTELQEVDIGTMDILLPEEQQKKAWLKENQTELLSTTQQ